MVGEEAAAAPDKISVVDASGEPGSVAEAIRRELATRFPELA